MTKKEQFIEWLGDAHAMEVGIVTTLEKHVADAKGAPKVRAALTKHLAETKRHASEMKKALAAMGGSHPMLKEGVSKLANLAAGLITSAPRDTMVKNAIADFATEHFEIACYTSLSLTAAALGETKIASTCKAIIKEEKAMAAQLQALFKEVNDGYLATLEDEKKPAASKKPEPQKPVAKPSKSAPSKAPVAKSPAKTSTTRKEASSR